MISPTIGVVGLALDLREIAEDATPLGVVKIVGNRLYDKCTPPELWLTGKCVMLAGGIVASVATGGNALIIGGTLSAFRAVIKKL